MFVVARGEVGVTGTMSSIQDFVDGVHVVGLSTLYLHDPKLHARTLR
jgi:hypothetical protein